MTPEDPQRLLAELESARLALQARPRPSRRRGIAIAIAILLVLGGITLWLLAMTADSLRPLKEKPSAAEEAGAGREKTPLPRASPGLRLAALAP